jgi:hypothetical protein
MSNIPDAPSLYVIYILRKGLSKRLNRLAGSVSQSHTLNTIMLRNWQPY